MDNYEKEMEKKLLEMMQQKEKHDKWLLTLEVVVGVMCIAIMLALILIAALVNTEEWLRLLLIVVGMLPLLICFILAVTVWCYASGSALQDAESQPPVETTETSPDTDETPSDTAEPADEGDAKPADV